MAICYYLVAGAWTLLWFVSYKLVYWRNWQYSPEFSCRILTLSHASIITLVSFYFLFIVGPWPFDSIGFKNTREGNRIIACSLGYFLFDFGWCLYHKTEGPLMLFHHIVCIVSIIACLAMDKSAIEILGALFGSESTSIVLNIRWFLKYKELYQNTLAGKLVDVMFVLLFISMRILLGGYFASCVLISPRQSTIIKLAGSLIYLVNILFLMEIISFSRYQLKKWFKPAAHKVQNEIVKSEKIKQNKKANGHISSKN